MMHDDDDLWAVAFWFGPSSFLFLLVLVVAYFLLDGNFPFLGAP